MDILLQHLGSGFIVMLMIAMPIVLTAAAIGLVVGILQAVTQVQEQTIAAAPKILGVFLVLIIMGPFAVGNLCEYLKTSANIAFGIIPRADEMVLSDKDFYLIKDFVEEEKYYKDETPTVKEIMKRAGKVPYIEEK